MHTLFIILVNFCLIFGQNHEQEDIFQQDRTILPLKEGLKQHLESDPVTSTILTSIYSQNFSEEVINLLHLSMNSLLVTSSLFASSDLENYANKFTMPRAPNAIQSEVESRIVHLRLSAPDVKDFQTAYKVRGNEIGNLINTKFGTHYSGGHFVSRSNQEKVSLASLLSLDEILSPLRRQTVHTLL